VDTRNTRHGVALGYVDDQFTVLNVNRVVSVIPSLINWEAESEDRAGFIIFI
jgi:hypothetical protein